MIPKSHNNSTVQYSTAQYNTVHKMCNKQDFHVGNLILGDLARTAEVFTL